ncbi:NAD(P)/FAD-dependent oxidoreductase [Spirosoma koreense]
MPSSPTQIVLLGGGYVSVWAYRSLIRHLRSQLATGQVAITVVAPYEYHCYHGWTAESLTGIIDNQNRLSPLTELMPKATLIRAEAQELDQVNQVVYLRTRAGAQQAIRYDHLLLGIGSFDTDTVEGSRVFGYQIKSPEAVQRTRQTLEKLVRKAAQSDPAMARRLLSITVAGGGLAGVELVTNLAEWIDLMKRPYETLRDVRPQIRLITCGPQVLTGLQPPFGRLIDYTEKTMRRYGIEVYTHTQLTKISLQGAYLSDGSFLESSMVFSTVGQSRFILAGTESMPRDSTERLITNAFQQVNDLPTVWGGGDACHVPHIQTGEACPANALWAMKHGEYAGRNIVRAINGHPLRPFTYKGLGQTASLGIGKGITELYGFQFTGPIAWLMRWFFFHYFMPSRRLMIRTIGNWFSLLFRGQRKGLKPFRPQKSVIHRERQLEHTMA